MMPATDSTVLGDFNDATFGRWRHHPLLPARGEVRDAPKGADGSQQDFEGEVHLRLHPLQQYLVEAPGGRMQVPRVSWDTDRGAGSTQYAGDHPAWRLAAWTGGAQNWNAMCATCHSTDLQRGYDRPPTATTPPGEHVTVS